MSPALMVMRQQSSSRGCASATRRSMLYTDAKLRSQDGRKALPQPKDSDRSLPVPRGRTATLGGGSSSSCTRGNGTVGGNL